MLRTSQADFKKMSTLLYHQPKWLVPVPAYLARGLTDRTTRPQIHDRYPYNSSYSEHCSLYEPFYLCNCAQDKRKRWRISK